MNPLRPNDDVVTRWQTLRREPMADCRIFRIHRDYKRHPRTQSLFDFYSIECPDWVNVVATTPEKELILVGQYRHGSETVEWEIPGGIIDPEDANPVEAGLRELREEAAFSGGRARRIGDIFPNPAIQNNRCHTVRVEDCLPTASQDLDSAEDIVVRLVPWKEAPNLIRSGLFRHSLVVVALTQALLDDGTW